MHSYEEAVRAAVEVGEIVGGERVPLSEAGGRVLVDPVLADRDLPPFHRSERDGWAVRSADLVGGRGALAWDGTVIYAGAGETPPLEQGACFKIMTGAPLPEGADAVVMVEKCRTDNGTVDLQEERIAPDLHVHRQGVDAVSGDVLVPAGVPLGPAQIAVAAAVGAAEVVVRRRVRVSIFATGDELVSISRTPGPSQIRDCNGPGLAALVRSFPWLEPALQRSVGDDRAALEQAIADAIERSDAVVLTGGVSMGDRDLVPDALAARGVDRRLHKVAIRPGKPYWLGSARDGTVVFGLPGNPVSVQVTFREFSLCTLRRIAGFADPMPHALELPLAKGIEKSIPLRQFVPARFVGGEQGTEVEPITYQGSGDFASAARADGVIVLAEGPSTIGPGSLVPFHPWGAS